MALFRKGTVKPSGDAQRERTRPPETEGAAPPKNGRLFLAVTASFLLMIALAVLNFKMIGDPSVAVKAFGPPASVSESEAGPFGCPAAAGANSGKSYDPPQVTFYRKLTAQEESPPEEEAETPSDETADRPVDPVKNDLSSSSTVSRLTVTDRDKPVNARRSAAPTAPPGKSVRLPRPAGGSKRYAVHVGTFSHPKIAQEWAGKWKARGHRALLKPVARPGAGVTYRLYLGSFRSRKDADDLIKRLKVREGITAFRVAVDG